MILSLNNLQLDKGKYRLHNKIFSGRGACVVLCQVCVNNILQPPFIIDLCMSGTKGCLDENMRLMRQVIQKVRLHYDPGEIFVVADGSKVNPQLIGSTMMLDMYHCMSNYICYVFNSSSIIINGVRIAIGDIINAHPYLGCLRTTVRGEQFSTILKKVVKGKLFLKYILSTQNEEENFFGRFLTAILNIVGAFDKELMEEDLPELIASNAFLMNVTIFKLRVNGAEILNAAGNCQRNNVTKIVTTIIDIRRRYNFNFTPHSFTIGDIYSLRGEIYSQYSNRLPPLKSCIDDILEIMRLGLGRRPIKTGFTSGMMQIIPTPIVFLNTILQLDGLERIEMMPNYNHDPETERQINNLPIIENFDLDFARRFILTLTGFNGFHRHNLLFIQDDSIAIRENEQLIDNIIALIN